MTSSGKYRSFPIRVAYFDTIETRAVPFLYSPAVSFLYTLWKNFSEGDLPAAALGVN